MNVMPTTMFELLPKKTLRVDWFATRVKQTVVISYPMVMTEMLVFVLVTFGRLFPLYASISKQRGLLIMKSLSVDSQLTVDIYFFMF